MNLSILNNVITKAFKFSWVMFLCLYIVFSQQFGSFFS